MRILLAATSLAFVLHLLPPTQVGSMGVPQAYAAHNEALYRSCRKTVFRVYGHREVRADGRHVRKLKKNFVVRQVDHCVANGGRVR
jgi:hypothetical protein